MSREDCIQVFKKHRYTEESIVNMIVVITGAKPGSLLEMKGLPMKAYLDTNLNIVYNNGKRYGKLEEAIKTLAYM
jgi:hypothetical protein